MTIVKNILAYGDNYDSLMYLIKEKKLSGKIQLVYIDPPYGTKQDFTFFGDRFATISRANGGRIAYRDNLTGEDYLNFLSCRLLLIRELLAENGSIYLHIDYKMGHYVKVLMDKIFGQDNFINDIARIKCNPKNFNRKGYGNVKDMILFYSKGKKCIWNDPRQEIKITKGDIRFKQIDNNGKLYTTTPLHAPGETKNGLTGKEWKGLFPPTGRHWRYTPKELDRLDKHGLIKWSSTGNPRKIIYAEDVEKAGVKMQDIWTYKDPQKSIYPTEKNIDLLRTIIKASSNKNDIVMDAFAGSGTTLVAATELDRKWIGIDASKKSISICKERIPNHEFIKIPKNLEKHESMVSTNLRNGYNGELLRPVTDSISARGC